MSLYQDDVASSEDVMKAMAILNEIFTLQGSFIKIVSARILGKGFTKQQLNDAVNKVIDEYQYPTLVPAALLSYDERIEVKSYKQMQKEGDWENWERMENGFYKRKEE